MLSNPDLGTINESIMFVSKNLLQQKLFYGKENTYLIHTYLNKYVKYDQIEISFYSTFGQSKTCKIIFSNESMYKENCPILMPS